MEKTAIKASTGQQSLQDIREAVAISTARQVAHRDVNQGIAETYRSSLEKVLKVSLENPNDFDVHSTQSFFIETPGLTRGDGLFRWQNQQKGGLEGSRGKLGETMTNQPNFFGTLFGAREKASSKARDRRPRVERAPADPRETGSGKWLPAAGGRFADDSSFSRASRIRATTHQD